MTTEDVKKRLYELYDIIEKHNYNYYVLDDPTVEDDEFSDSSIISLDLWPSCPQVRPWWARASILSL